MHYISKYKPFLIFLAKFFAVYMILAVLYQLWLGSYDRGQTVVDPLTASVAYQSEWLLQVFGSDARVVAEPGSPFLRLMINGEYTARIVEGCNAVSVMILFVSFIVAFAGKLKTTFIFSLAGFAVIHLLNIARIAILAAAIHHFPEHEHFLHGVIFPLFIYGVVFLLWVIWVNRFSYFADVKK